MIITRIRLLLSTLEYIQVSSKLGFLLCGLRQIRRYQCRLCWNGSEKMAWPNPLTEFKIDHTLALDLQGPHSGDPSGRRRCTKEEEAPAQAAVPLPQVPQGVELALGAQTSLDHAFQREGETGCLSLQVQRVWERIPVEEGLGPAHEASHRRKAPGLLSLWQEVCHQVGSLKQKFPLICHLQI